MTERDRIVVAVVPLVAAIAAFWFLLLAPKREELKTVEADLGKAKQELTTSLSSLAAGSAAKRDYARNYAMVAKLGQAVPADDGMTSLVFQLDTAASQADVDFRAVKLTGTAAAATTPAPPAPPAPPAEGSSTETTPTDTATATTATTDPTQAATATLPPGVTVGPAGFPTMPFALTFDGDFFRLDSYFGSLLDLVEARGESVDVGGRLVAIDGISLTAGRDGFPSVKASVAATTYLLPADQGLTGGATSASPAVTPASTTDPATGTSPAPAPATVTPAATR